FVPSCLGGSSLALPQKRCETLAPPAYSWFNFRRRIVAAGGTMGAGRSINVTEIIDGRGFGRFQLAVAIWCGFLVMLDGFDIGTTAYVVPVIAPLWQISPAGFAPVFLATLVGVLFGTLAAGPLADRFGRKRVALVAVLTFGVFELLT